LWNGYPQMSGTSTRPVCITFLQRVI